jgi:F-type H+-transporting ATPase subunit alpha
VVFSKESVGLGTKLARTGNSLTVSCGDGMIGHVVSALGYDLDEEKEPSKESESVVIDKEALGIDRRVIITKPLLTGTTMVDLALPLGEGQRELVIGERKTGKTWFALQTLANQVRLGKIGIYCAIGKQAGEIVAVREWLEKNKVMEGSIIVATGARENQAEIVMAPFTALAIAEHLGDHGNNVFVVLDDLTTHAKYFREMSLMMGKFPGRDSYPGDIFYLQSKLLERAGCFDVDGKEKSISCMPIAESVGGDLTGYIQTNLMSITDGHIYFDLDRFQHGARPAVNIFLSVTRVGRQTRNKLFHTVSTEIYSILKKVEAAKVFTKFGPEQTEEVKRALTKGDNMDKFLIQANTRIYDEWEMLYLYAWYRRDEAVISSPDELLKKIQSKEAVEAWKKFISETESVEKLSDRKSVV